MTRKMLAEERELRSHIKLMFGHRLHGRVTMNKLITALVRAVREDCAKVAEDEWKNADNTRPEYRQNKISHGCLAAAAAIRGR